MPKVTRRRRVWANKKDPTQDTPSKPGHLTYVVGNTYKHLPSQRKQPHDWIVYLDVIAGDADLVDCVWFGFGSASTPSSVTCNTPVPTTREDGSRVMRFSTRQRSSEPPKPRLRLKGRGGSAMTLTHKLKFQSGGAQSNLKTFHETRPLRPFHFLRVPRVDYGIEIEVSCAKGTPQEEIAEYVRQHEGIDVKAIAEYRDAHKHIQSWKLVHDGSIVCSRHSPDCSRFELVSPILTGGPDLIKVSKVLMGLKNSGSISVNKSMGFHVHVSVDGLTLQDLINVCLNFVKYEDAIDTFMPPSRRTGSEESNQYCKSNKAAILGKKALNLDRHKRICSSKTLEELCRLMNPTGRYYKLNMENLRIGRIPTIEFRQHSATSNYEKVAAWVRFCIALVHNSATLPRPASLKDSRGIVEQFDMMFQHVIKDRALREVYAKRREEVNSDGEECCSSCAHGGKCGGLDQDLFLPLNNIS